MVGASAPSTPHLLADPRLAHDARLSFVLHGRDARRLDAVHRAAVVLEPALASRLCTSINLCAALDGAALVVVQLRAGGLAARAHDERFPLAEGIPGDEGLGPGGLAAAWRAWPAVRDVLAAVAAQAPQARVALLTAPLGILTRCAFAAFPELDVAGLCELPAVVLGEIAAAVKVAEPIAFRYAGVNHLGWFTSLERDGEDLVEAYAATRENASYPSAATIRATQTVPLPYVRLQDERDAVVTEQRAAQRTGTARAAVLAEIAAAAYDAFERGDPAAIRTALARRPVPWYARAVAPWIRAALDGSSDDVFFLTVRNAGYLEGFSAGDVVEVPHAVRDGAFVAGPAHAPPPAIAAVLRALISYEALAANAVLARDGAAIECALAAHPWVASAAIASRLAPFVAADATARATSSA